MKTRIKKIEYSDGRVEYIPQIKKFGYEISPHEQRIRKEEWWLLIIPIFNLFICAGLIDQLFWQSYNKVCDEHSAFEILDETLEEYNTLSKKKVKVTKKIEYIKHT